MGSDSTQKPVCANYLEHTKPCWWFTDSAMRSIPGGLDANVYRLDYNLSACKRQPLKGKRILLSRQSLRALGEHLYVNSRNIPQDSSIPNLLNSPKCNSGGNRWSVFPAYSPECTSSSAAKFGGMEVEWASAKHTQIFAGTAWLPNFMMCLMYQGLTSSDYMVFSP